MEQSKKQRIRQEMKELRNGLDVFAVENLSVEIFNRFLELDLSDYDQFFVYNSFGSEVRTKNIIEYLLANNKKVYMPRVKGLTMQSVPIDKNTKYLKNHYGITEPIGNHEEINNFVAIIPCLAVDNSGNRIGYGKGYYDKFLKNKNSLKMILCYDFQIIEDFVPNELDIPADMIITDKRILEIQANKEKVN